MSSVALGRLSIFDVLREQCRVIGALMLWDVKTRFFGNRLAFLLAPAWPLSHILIIIFLYGFMNRAIPYGDSAMLWVATGVVPFMAYNYVSRNACLGMVMLKPLLNHSTVKVTDILFARCLIEILTTAIVVIIIGILFTIYDIDFMPIDVPQACLGMAACVFLGISFGAINAVIAGFFPFWVTAFFLTSIVLWISSGVMFVPDSLPEPISYILSFNPILQGVEWVRSAYYDGYGDKVLDKQYMLIFAVVSLALGLAAERGFRGKVLGA
jgi:capsular polysaccharide transport system permease protein